jgi:tripartite-type tricarboxylate transporter receptor subunit TctC
MRFLARGGRRPYELFIPFAQTERTIKVVVAVPAAGPGDEVAHLFADQMRQAFIRAHGPTLEIESRTMAGGAVTYL